MARQLAVEPREVVDDAAQVAVALGDGGRHAGEVAVRRLEQAHRGAEVAAPVVEALTQSLHEQLHVVARLLVE